MYSRSKEFFFQSSHKQLLMGEKIEFFLLFLRFQFLFNPGTFQGGSRAPQVLSQRQSLASLISLQLPRTTLSPLRICFWKDFDGGFRDGGEGDDRDRLGLLTQCRPL